MPRIRTTRGRLVTSTAVVLALVLFVPHAVQAWRHEVSPWDRSLSEAIHAWENRDTILNARVDLLGVVLDPMLHFVGVLLVLGVAAHLYLQGEKRSALVVAVTFTAATLLGLALKEVFGRPPVDPGGSGHTFPSGHAMRTMAGAAALALVAWPTRWRWHVVVGGCVFVLLTGVAVVYHEWHWISDVLAGWYLAVALLGSVWLVLGHERVVRRLGR